jgi:hypothetical protein
MFPVGRAAAVEILPGHEADPWTAYRWFTGAGGNGEPPGPDSPLTLWGEHEQLAAHVAALQRSVAESRHASAEQQRLDVTLTALRRVRATIRGQGLTPPEVSPETARALGDDDSVIAPRTAAQAADAAETFRRTREFARSRKDADGSR